MAGTVLVVEDSPEMGELIREALAGTDWRVATTPDLATAHVCLIEARCDLLVTGLGTSSAEDLRTLRRLRRAHPKVKMIVLARDRQPGHVIDALRAHAFSYFGWPCPAAELRDMVARGLAEPDWDDGIELISDRPDWVAVRVRCRMLSADRLLHFVDELSSDLTADDRASVGAAFREILLNAIEHGGQFHDDKYVEIARILMPDAIMYLVRDPGQGFKPGALPHAASDSGDPTRHIEYRIEQGLRPGGFGLLVARGMVDVLLHNARGNEALLVKYLRREPS